MRAIGPCSLTRHVAQPRAVQRGPHDARRARSLARASKSARWSGAGPTCQASARVRLVGLRRAADAIQLLAEAVVVGPRRAEAVNAPAVARLSRACARVPESEVWAPGHVACALLAFAPVWRGPCLIAFSIRAVVDVVVVVVSPSGASASDRGLKSPGADVGRVPARLQLSPGAAATSPGADVARHGSSPWGEPPIQLRTAETALCETRHATRTVRRAAEPVLKPGGPTRPSASVDSASGRCLPCCLLPIHT